MSSRACGESAVLAKKKDCDLKHADEIADVRVVPDAARR